MKKIIILSLSVLLFVPFNSYAQNKKLKVCINESNDQITAKRKCKASKNEVQASAANLRSLAGIPKILLAVTDEVPNIIYGPNVISAVNLDKSEYHIKFDQDITDCIPIVSKAENSNGGFNSNGSVATAVDTDEGNDTLYVAVFDGNNSAEAGLNIALICP
ncbi:MAG: hypothetical protein KDD56_06325 [Bdellovibrionales bacterium]|nr:hypothetical protein [Bdellovibrionales bacterium]